MPSDGKIKSPGIQYVIFFDRMVVGLQLASSRITWALRRVAESLFTKLGLWQDSVEFSQQKQQNTEFTKFLQSGPRKLTKSDFSGLAPIR